MGVSVGGVEEKVGLGVETVGAGAGAAVVGNSGAFADGVSNNLGCCCVGCGVGCCIGAGVGVVGLAGVAGAGVGAGSRAFRLDWTCSRSIGT